MRRQLGDEYWSLLLGDALLEKNLVALSEDNADKEFDDFATEISGRSMKEVLVDVGEHSSACPEIVVSAFETFGVGSILTGRDGGMRSCDEEDDGSLFVSDRGLGDLLVREGISPGEIDPDFWEAKLH